MINRETDVEPAHLLVVNREPHAIAEALTAGPAARWFRVETMRRADTLIDRLHTAQPDLLLLGLVVPGADSLVLCRQLKTDPATSDVPVIMTNISADPSEVIASFNAGADDFLIDPPYPGEVVARVRLMLRMKRQYESLLRDNLELAERLLVKNRELEAALTEVSNARLMSDHIVSNLAHELKTPLLQVKSAVGMLRTDWREGGPTLVDKLIGHAVAATARLEGVIANLGQLASVMQPSKVEPFRLQDAVYTAVRQLGREWQLAATNAVSRVVVYLDGIPPVQSDRSGVTQVLQQLIDNALKFSPEGGPIEICAWEGDGGLWVAVQDNGIGIAENEYDNIFRAFYQVNSSTTRPFGGAGIGLTIVKMILDKLKVPFELDSVPGHGSTFRFWLPLAEL